MNQRCGLQRVPTPLVAQVILSQAAQLLINDRHQLVESSLVALSPTYE